MKKTNDNQNALMIGGGLVALWFMFSSAGRKGGIISKYYSIEEVQKSDTAVDQNIIQQFQTLPAEIMNNVNGLIHYLLDPLTEILGNKLVIESWWRSEVLNSAVGGVGTSFHLYGFAVDVDSVKNGIVDNKRLVKAVLENNLPFTEMILYNSVSKPTQIHLALDPNRSNEKQILFKDDNGNYHDLNRDQLLTLYMNVTV